MTRPSAGRRRHRPPGPAASVHPRRDRSAGFAGDTAASAALANGIVRVGNSASICGRPRGVPSAGVEEPNALVRTSGAFPRVDAPRHDAGAGRRARLAGRIAGSAPSTSRPTRPLRHLHVHTDVAVVGAGPAGLAAARAAVATGARVTLLEQDSEPGGCLLGARTTVEGKPAHEWVAEVGQQLPRFRHVESSPDNRFRQLRQQLPARAGAAHRPPRRRGRGASPGSGCGTSARGASSWHRRARAAAGLRRQRPARGDACLRHTQLSAPLWRARRANGRSSSPPTTPPTPRRGPGPPPAPRCRPDRRPPDAPARRAGGVPGPRHPGAGRLGRHRHPRRRAVERRALAAPAADGEAREIGCDLLPCQRRLEPRGAPVQPGPGRPALRRRAWRLRARRQLHGPVVAGSAAGVLGPGRLPGRAASGRRCARWPTSASSRPTAAPERARARRRPSLRWCCGGCRTRPARGDGQFVDLQRDATVADIARAVGAGMRSMEHVKRYTTIGTAHDQGKTSGVLTPGHPGRAARRAGGEHRDDDLPAAVHPGRVRGAGRP